MTRSRYSLLQAVFTATGDWATILPISAVRTHAATGAAGQQDQQSDGNSRAVHDPPDDDRRFDHRCVQFVEMFTAHLHAPLHH